MHYSQYFLIQPKLWLVDVEGGNNLLYLPLDKIMEENKKKGDDDE